MPDLNFQIESCRALTHSAAPGLVFQLRLTNPRSEETIQNVLLQCQIQIEVARRQYTPEEQRKLRDLFGEPERWSETLRTTYWTTVQTSAPSFSDTSLIELHVPCTFDFNVAATKYFAGLESGEVPLCFLFSGTVFYSRDDAHDHEGGQGLQIDQISWNKECKYRLAVSVWQSMMDHYYPNGAWLRLRRDIFDRLFQYKVDNAIPSWERVIESLLKSVESESLRS